MSVSNELNIFAEDIVNYYIGRTQEQKELGRNKEWESCASNRLLALAQYIAPCQAQMQSERD